MKEKKVIQLDKTIKSNTFELTSNKDDWWVISQGYYLLAKIGSEHVIEKGDKQDYLAYPVIYCFRHYIELELKGLTMELKKLKGEKYKINPSHNLNNILRDFIGEYETYYDLKFDTGIVELIKQFNKIDPIGQVFRYCSDKKGKSIKRIGLHVGFSNLMKVMDEIFQSLDSIESHIDATNDQIQERYTSIDLP